MSGSLLGIALAISDILTENFIVSGFLSFSENMS